MAVAGCNTSLSRGTRESPSLESWKGLSRLAQEGAAGHGGADGKWHVPHAARALPDIAWRKAAALQSGPQGLVVTVKPGSSFPRRTRKGKGGLSNEMSPS